MTEFQTAVMSFSDKETLISVMFINRPQVDLTFKTSNKLCKTKQNEINYMFMKTKTKYFKKGLYLTPYLFC